MNLGMYEFLTVILLTLGLGMLLSGVFTAYFGRGKSRRVGLSLIVVGALFWVGTYIAHSEEIFGDTGFGEIIKAGLFYVGAFVVGAVIAIAIFLVAIMKT